MGVLIMAFYFHKFLGRLRRVKRKTLTLTLVVVCLFLLASGCQSLSSPAAQIDSNRGDWEADVGKIKTTATFYAKQVRSKVSESDPTRSALEQKYREARMAVNLWIQDVQDSIKAGRPPSESSLYKLREIAANEKYSRFVISAEEAVELDVRPKWLPLAALAPGAWISCGSVLSKLPRNAPTKPGGCVPSTRLGLTSTACRTSRRQIDPYLT
jgi:hypothetical protein